MALIKIINKGQNANLIGGNFTNAASETVFNLGTFNVSTNLESRIVRDYSNDLSRFVQPITLSSLNLNEVESKSIVNLTSSVKLNLDKSDLLSHARYGSLKELFKASINKIILEYPASAFVNTFLNNGLTITNFQFDELNGYSTFNVSVGTIGNRFGLIFRADNFEILDNNSLSNLNLSFGEYVIWKPTDYDNYVHEIIGFTGQTSLTNYITITCNGNPFPELSGNTQGRVTFHIRPKSIHFNKFKKNLSAIESFLLEKRKTTEGFEVEFKRPLTMDDGSVIYTNNKYLWPTTDGYNIDTDGSNFTTYVANIGLLGDEYDKTKTDLILRFLTPTSIKDYDSTDGEKVKKLLRVYGREFDQLKLYIDSLAYVYKLSYNKNKNMPDILVKNFAKTMGWDSFNLLGENDLLESFFSTTEISHKSNQLLPTDIDIELWRRILLNTMYYFRSKGTRHSLKSMLVLLGIPDPFINITEYIYTVSGRINPDEVTLTIDDLPSASLPYNEDGYPIAPKESNTFYFQLSGDTDSGQQYIDVYRQVGFKVSRTVDNKKSWTEEGKVIRSHYSTPNYQQNDSKLIINTKEIVATLDTARGVEYDVYNFNSEQNFPVVSTGVTQAYVYINIPFNYGVNTNILTTPERTFGDVQVNFNGITLQPRTGSTDTQYEYRIVSSGMTGTTILLNSIVAQTYSNGSKDIITLTYMNDRLGDYATSEIKYVVTKPKAITGGGTLIELPEEPNGDVQLTVDGISLSKGTSLFTGDYMINPLNRTQLIITNSRLQSYLQQNPIVTISYFTANSSGGRLYKETEVYKVDTLFTSKCYYNALILKTVYVLNYEALNIDAIKIAFNGITLQNGTDFILNSTNKKEVYLNIQVKSNDIITAYYVLTDSGELSDEVSLLRVTTPVSQMSFLEYIDMIRTRMINVKNRKIFTDHEGGFYPTLYKIYNEYQRYSLLPDGHFQQSNGYTFSNLFAFTNQFAVAFQKFMNELLSATVIVRKGGFQIRNTIFTQQKFTYKRGLSFNERLNWFGDDGAEFRYEIGEPITLYSWSGLTCVSDTLCGMIISDVELVSELNSTTTTTTSTTTTTTTTTTTQSPVKFAGAAMLLQDFRDTTYELLINGPVGANVEITASELSSDGPINITGSNPFTVNILTNPQPHQIVIRTGSVIGSYGTIRLTITTTSAGNISAPNTIDLYAETVDGTLIS